MYLWRTRREIDNNSAALLFFRERLLFFRKGILVFAAQEDVGRRVEFEKLYCLLDCGLHSRPMLRIAFRTSDRRLVTPIHCDPSFLSQHQNEMLIVPNELAALAPELVDNLSGCGVEKRQEKLRDSRAGRTSWTVIRSF